MNLLESILNEGDLRSKWAGTSGTGRAIRNHTRGNLYHDYELFQKYLEDKVEFSKYINDSDIDRAFNSSYYHRDPDSWVELLPKDNCIKFFVKFFFDPELIDLHEAEDSLVDSFYEFIDMWDAQYTDNENMRFDLDGKSDLRYSINSSINRWGACVGGENSIEFEIDMHGEPPAESKPEPKAVENPGKPKVILHKKENCMTSRLFESIVREKIEYPQPFTSGLRYMNFNLVASKVESMLKEKSLSPKDPEFEDFLQECLDKIDPDMPEECREESLRLVRAGFKRENGKVRLKGGVTFRGKN